MINKLIYLKLSVNSELYLELAPGKRLGFFINPELTLDLKEKFFNSYKTHFCIYLFLQIKSVITIITDNHKKNRSFDKKTKKIFIL